MTESPEPLTSEPGPNGLERTASSAPASDRARLSPVFAILARLVRFAREEPLLAVGLVGITVIAGSAVFADVLAPHDPLDINRSVRLEPPSTDYVMGTDRYGRDIYSRVIHGTRTSLGTAFLSVITAAIVGTAIGLVSGYRGRRTDQVLMRGMDIVFAFPALLFAITLAASLGPSTFNASLAIAIIFIPVFARIVRGSVLATVSQEYVDASRTIGSRDSRTLLVHILPNVLTPIIVQLSMALAAAILLESALSYLGLGTQPPQASWGTLLNEGRVFLTRAPWMSVFPGIVIASSVFLFFVLGDGLRDRLDPTHR